MKYLLMLFLISSCGKNISDFIQGKGNPKRGKTDPVFREFVDSFSQRFNISVGVPITFKPIEQKYAGVCLVYVNGYREIRINKIYWESYSREQKEQLIFHELGHCVLNRGHDDSLIFNTNCPNSIMRSFMFSQHEINTCYLPNYNYYMEDLGI